MPKLKLTAQTLKGLPTPLSGRVDYQDVEVPGLILRVSASGARSWSVSYWKGGRRPRVTLGDAALLGLSEARAEARGLLRDVKLGIDPAAVKREKAAASTFAELAAEYIKRHAKAKKTKRGAREDELRIDRVLVPRWGTRRAGDVRKRDVVELLDEYQDAGKGYARNRMAALVSKIYSFGLDRDVPGVTTNPARGLVDRDLEKPRTRVLSDDELKILLPLFRAEGLTGLGFRLLLLTGQRPGEVYGMRWSEVDGATWSLPKERSKNRRSKHAPDLHVVPLSAAARAVLQELKGFSDGSGFVFPSRIENKPFTNYQKAVERVKEKAALGEDWTLYDAKTACLTGLEKLGTPPHVVSLVANHVSAGVTRQHYAFHDFEAEKRDVLERWGAHVEALDPSTQAGVVKIRRRA